MCVRVEAGQDKNGGKNNSRRASEGDGETRPVDMAGDCIPSQSPTPPSTSPSLRHN